MRNVTYSLGMSMDGYVMDLDGKFDWAPPDEEVFRFCIDEITGVGVHLLGRRLYESMLYWETTDHDPPLDDAELEWTALWKALPRVVFSRTLSSVQGHARLASGSLADEIERLRAEPGPGAIAIGGAALAAQAADLNLIDEYRIRVFPVLVGGGTPFFAQHGRRVDLELARDPHLHLRSRLPAPPRRALVLRERQPLLFERLLALHQLVAARRSIRRGARGRRPRLPW